MSERKGVKSKNTNRKEYNSNEKKLIKELISKKKTAVRINEKD